MTQFLEQNEKISFAKQKKIMEALQITEPVIFDVGANIGQSILQYKKDFPSSSIFSFEANKVVMDQLKAVAEASTNVQCFNLALSDFTGETQFYATALPEVGSLLPPEKRIMALSQNKYYDFSEISVPVTTLDAFYEQHNINMIDILKIDVQGGEMRVLQGAKETLASSKIKLIYVEVIMAPSYVGQAKLGEVLLYLENLRYLLWEIMPFLYTRSGRVWAANAVFLQDDTLRQIEEL